MELWKLSISSCFAKCYSVACTDWQGYYWNGATEVQKSMLQLNVMICFGHCIKAWIMREHATFQSVDSPLVHCRWRVRSPKTFLVCHQFILYLSRTWHWLQANGYGFERSVCCQKDIVVMALLKWLSCRQSIVGFEMRTMREKLDLHYIITGLTHIVLKPTNV